MSFFSLQELVENNEDHRDLIRFFDWFILPITNPDGYERCVACKAKVE